MHRLGPYFFAAALAFLGATLAAVVHVTTARAGHSLVEVSIPEFSRSSVDRCPTCHAVALGAEYPQGHPAVPGYHPVERFGCALCHGGEPRAVDRRWAHERGREPLLHLAGQKVRRERLEAGCARCHAQVSPELSYDVNIAPHVAQGLQLFVQRGCWGCHGLADVSLGERGPDLSDVGLRLNGQEIELAIADPSAAPSSTTMPRFRLPEGEHQDLVTFLLAQVDPRRRDALTTTRLMAARQPGSTPRRPPVNPGMAEGARVMAEMGCVACHQLQMYDGQVGPDLRWEGALRGPQFVEDMIRYPASTVHNSRMPPFDLSASEVDAVIAFLARQLALPPPSAEESWRQICARCHGLDGRGRTAVAPYLARRPRDVTDEKFFLQAPPRRLAQAVTEGIPGTPMAPWGLALPHLEGMRVVHFLAQEFHEGAMPRLRSRPLSPREGVTPDRREATRVFQLECAKCHGPTGQGDGPEAPPLRPQPRDLNNSLFIESLSSERLYRSIAHGPPGEVMPGHLWGHSPAVIWALVDQVRALAGTPTAGPHHEDEWPWRRVDRIRRQRRLQRLRTASEKQRPATGEPATREAPPGTATPAPPRTPTPTEQQPGQPAPPPQGGQPPPP